jgi:hypothetical protein
MDDESITLTRQAWIDGFVAYVIGRAPRASATLLAQRAEKLYRHLGRFDPVEAAEAEWDELPLPKD